MSLDVVGTVNITATAESPETEINEKMGRINVFGQRTLNHLSSGQLKDFRQLGGRLGLVDGSLGRQIQTSENREVVNQTLGMVLTEIKSFWDGAITPLLNNVSMVVDSPKGNRVLLGTNGGTYSQKGVIAKITLLFARMRGVSFDKNKVVQTLTSTQTRLQDTKIEGRAVLSPKEEATLNQINLLIARLQGKTEESQTGAGTILDSGEIDSTQPWSKLVPDLGPFPIVGAPKGASPLYTAK